MFDNFSPWILLRVILVLPSMVVVDDLSFSNISGVTGMPPLCSLLRRCARASISSASRELPENKYWRG